MDSKRVKPHTWLWWVGEDKPVYIWEVLSSTHVLACIPRPARSFMPTMNNKVIRTLDLVGLGEIGELEF